MSELRTAANATAFYSHAELLQVRFPPFPAVRRQRVPIARHGHLHSRHLFMFNQAARRQTAIDFGVFPAATASLYQAG